MERTLSILKEYCVNWKLVVNTSKSKIMWSSSTKRKDRISISYDGSVLEEVDSFKYLGFLLSNRGKLLIGVTDLVYRAKKAYFAMLTKVRRFGGLPVPKYCYVFTALVELSCTMAVRSGVLW